MTNAITTERLGLAAGAAVFCVLAILNCGGYRYGVGDQAFYIPSVTQHLDPGLFPRDRMLLHVQDRFMAFDDLSALFVKATHVPLPVVWFGLYMSSLLLLFGAAVVIGRHFYRSWWTVALLAALLTFRHRITQTGANSLEAYFQPRLLACAVGLCAIACYVRGRMVLTLALVATAFLIHPTTALWFGVWITVAIAVSERSWRAYMLGVFAGGAGVAGWMLLFGPLRAGLRTMDPRWAAVLAGKDYIFPHDWTATFWIVNLGYVGVIAAAYLFRRREGIAGTRELGLVAGALALLGVFLVSWMLMREWVVVALQFQPSRVFWMLDLFATIYVAWLLGEKGAGVIFQKNDSGTFFRKALVAAVIAIAAARGVYVTYQEHGGAPLVSVHLPRDNWTYAMAWLATTPTSSHVLADPGHAWKYGSSVRVAAQRDVYLEEVKDTAVALYSRDVAMRVLGRIQDASSFDSLTPERALAMARQYDLNYLVIDRDMNLPLAYRNTQFRIYSLRPATSQ
jgi:hypothetical protein